MKYIPVFHPFGVALRSKSVPDGFVTKDFTKKWNNSVYFRLSKMLCGFKDQVRARPSGEKCGLKPDPPYIELESKYIIKTLIFFAFSAPLRLCVKFFTCMQQNKLQHAYFEPLKIDIFGRFHYYLHPRCEMWHLL